MIDEVTLVCKEDILPKVKQENTMSVIRKDHVTRIHYGHPNHMNRYFNQLMYHIALYKGKI